MDCPVNEFAEKMKCLILRTTETQDKLLNSPAIPDLKVDDIYTNMVIQPGRVKFDFQEKKRNWFYPDRDVLVERTEQLFLPTVDIKNPKSILIKGRAGMGKTLFSQMLVRELAKGSLFSEEKNKSKFKIVFLFTFQQLNLIDKAITLREFLSLSSFCPEMTDDTFDYILRNPDNVLFVFDGFDECRYQCIANHIHDVPKEGRLTFAALFAKIAMGKLLTNATVVITTRPEAQKVDKGLDDLKIQRGVEMLGFNHHQVEAYITKFFASKKGERQLLLDHILGSENLITLCYAPVQCFLVCSYLDWHLQEFPTSHDAELPSKITELYQGVVRMFLLKHHTGCSAEKKPRLSGCVQSTMAKLSELSLEFLKLKKFVFSDEDLQSYGINEEEVSRLLNSGLILCMPGRRTGPFIIETYYCFLHLTLQEFLAACCLVKTGKLLSLLSAGRDISEILETLSDVLTVFVAGVLGTGDKQSCDSVMVSNVKTEDANAIMYSIVDDHEYSHEKLMRVLHEYGDKNFTQKVLQEHDLGDLDLFELFNDTDCQALTFLLTTKVEAEHQVKRLDIDDPQMSHRGMRYIKEALCSENCQLEELILTSSTSLVVNEDDQIVMQLSEALVNKNCHLVSLELSGIHVGDKGAEYLNSALSSGDCHLTKLDLSNNQISDEGAEYLSRALGSDKCRLTELDLSNNQISDEGDEYLSRALDSEECNLTLLNL